MMTPEEKWNRITHRKTADDYGVVLTQEELETCPAGRALLAEIREHRGIPDSEALAMMETLGNNAAKAAEQLALFGTAAKAAMQPSKPSRGEGWLMLMARHFSEWLYYGFWYLCTHLVLALPRCLVCNDRWLRQPFLWIYQMGLVFAYLPTLMERRAELEFWKAVGGGEQ